MRHALLAALLAGCTAVHAMAAQPGVPHYTDVACRPTKNGVTTRLRFGSGMTCDEAEKAVRQSRVPRGWSVLFTRGIIAFDLSEDGHIGRRLVEVFPQHRLVEVDARYPGLLQFVHGGFR